MRDREMRLRPIFAVQDFGEDLGRLRDRHPGAIEKQIAVGKRDVAVADGPQIAPPRMPFEHGLLALGPLQVEAAGRDDQIFGIGVAKMFGGYRGREFARVTEQRFAVCDLDQLGAPVAHGEKRIGPFQHDDGGPAQTRGPLPHGF